MKKVLITGISGFAGSFLAEHLLSRGGYTIVGTFLSDQSLETIANISKEVELEKVNLLEEKRVYALVHKVKPEFVFHLSALTSAAASFKNPAATITQNVTMQINLLEAIRESASNARILIVSSADIYGMVKKEELPINESVAFRPVNPYAVSKITQDFLGLQYFLSYGLQVVRVRPFNHIGPRQAPYFVIPSFAKQIAEIEKGKKEPVLRVGNLETKRDFTDVRDIVRAYEMLLEGGVVGEVYNLGTGVSHKIADILDTLLSLSSAKIDVRVDSKLLRPSDEPELVCNTTKIKEAIGWGPKYTLEETLRDTLDYWRNIV